MIPNIEDVSNPVVGRFYMVLCAYGPRPHISKRLWWPVIGPWHEDAEIVSFPWYHFHYDHRFVTEKEFMRPRNPFSKVHMREVSIEADKEPIRTIRLKCKMKRQMPGFPDHARWMKELESEYAYTKLKCHRCPHKNLPLDGMPIQPDGTVICPGHGLKWHLESGRLVPRVTVFEAARNYNLGARDYNL